MTQTDPHFDLLNFYLDNASADQMIKTLALPRSEDYSDALANQHARHIEKFFENINTRRSGNFIDEYVDKQLALVGVGQIDQWTLLLTGYAPRPPQFSNKVLTRFLAVKDDDVFCDLVENCLVATPHVPDIDGSAKWEYKLRSHFAGYSAIDKIIDRYKDHRPR